jgi:hypothetical protein
VSRKIRDSILEKRWPRNDFDEKDDPYKIPTFTFNREMDQLVVANIVNNEMDEENIHGRMTKKKAKGQREHT